MKFRKKHSNITVFMAMLHGLLIGIAAVAIIGFVLTGTNGKKTGAKPEDDAPSKQQPVSGEADTPASSSVEALKMYARQNGAFSTPASAASFIAADPALATAAIIRSGDQYFVWTAVGLTENEVMKDAGEDSFKKVFTADTSACEVVGAQMLRDVLAADDLAKIKSLAEEKADEKMAEFNQNVDTITAFTNDLRVIRLHLLSQYSYSKDCVKIGF